MSFKCLGDMNRIKDVGEKNLDKSIYNNNE